MSENKLEKFFNPKSVAVIGASSNREKIGYGIMRNLLDAKFKGKIYPINLNDKRIANLKAYPSVAEVPGKVDLAIIVIPAQFVNATLVQCGEKGIGHIIVITAGFKEIGKEGAKLEGEMLGIAAKYGMQIVGPNCLGLEDSIHKLNASFANGMVAKGSLGFISQSGAICSAMLDWAEANGVGFSSFVSVGNKAVVSEAELLDYYKTDKNTTAVIAYLESIKEGEKFMRAAAELSAVKPLVVIKPGTSEQAQHAMQSHTGALAGADGTVQVAFAQAGITRVTNMGELFDTSKFFSRFDRLKGNRIAIITNAGGPGVIATDEIEGCGLTMASISKKGQELLRKALPAEANVHNPVDVLGDAKEDRFQLALEVLAEEKGIDGIVFILTPQKGTPFEKIAQVLVEMDKRIEKPIVASFIGGKQMEKEVKKLKLSPLPTYEDLSGAIKALGRAWQCECNRKRAKTYLSLCSASRKQEAAQLAEKLTANPDFLQALDLLKGYGIPVADSRLATSSEEAVKHAKSIGYPVAMKIFSATITHKTDVEGVKVNLASDLEVRQYFDKIKKALGKDLQGMIVQPMLGGAELILGLKRDENFGPMLMFGLGGIFAEVTKDVSFRFAPIDRTEALAMMREIKSFKTLDGYRGRPKMDVEAVAEALVGLSRLAIAHPEIKELDINPLFAREAGKGCVAVDVRMMI
jgi:acetyltransferase